MIPLLALALFGSLHAKAGYTFDPAAIATFHCQPKYVEKVGSFTYCRKARLTFGSIKPGANMPESIRLNYSDGNMLQYYPRRCKLKFEKTQAYECPDVLTGPQIK